MINETQTLISLINQSGGIPLNIVSTTTTNPYQFYITLLISAFGIIFLFGITFKEKIEKAITLIYLKSISKKNGRGIILIKHTMSDLFNQAMIDRKTMEDMERALMKMGNKPLDIILYTPGGEIFSATYISRMLTNYKGHKRAIVPIYSMSGGTLLALSCDEIYMNDYSCLGAVDPQLGNLFKFGSARSWKEVIKLKGNKAEDSSISFKFIGEQYTKSIRNNLKELLSNKVRDKKDLNKLAEYLTSGEIEHGFNLTKQVLNQKGLLVGDLSPETNIRLSKLLRIAPQGVSFKV